MHVILVVVNRDKIEFDRHVIPIDLVYFKSSIYIL